MANEVAQTVDIRNNININVHGENDLDKLISKLSKIQEKADSLNGDHLIDAAAFNKYERQLTSIEKLKDDIFKLGDNNIKLLFNQVLDESQPERYATRLNELKESIISIKNELSNSNIIKNIEAEASKLQQSFTDLVLAGGSINTVYDGIARLSGLINSTNLDMLSSDQLNIINEYKQDLLNIIPALDNIKTSTNVFSDIENDVANLQRGFTDIVSYGGNVNEVYNNIDKLSEKLNNIDISILNKDQLNYINELKQDLLNLIPAVDEIAKRNDILNKIENGGAINLLNSMKGESNITPIEEQRKIWQDTINSIEQGNNRIIQQDGTRISLQEHLNKLKQEEVNKQKEEIELLRNKIVKPDFNVEYSGASPQDIAWLNNVNFDNLEEDDKKVNKLKDTLIQLASSGNISTSSIKTLLKTLGASAPQIAAVGASLGVILAYLKQVSNAVDEIISGIKQGGKYTTDFLNKLTGFNINLAVDGLKGFNDVIKNTINLLKNTSNEIKNLSAYGIEAQNAFFRIYQYLGSESGNELISYTEKLSELFNLDAANLETNMKGILATTSQLGLQSDGVIKYTKALTNLALNLSAFSGDSIDNISKQFENVINLGILNSRSSIAKALDLNDQDIAEFKNLNTQIERTNFLLNKGVIIEGTYDRYTQTMAGSLMQLRNVYNNLMSTVGLFASYLASAVTPILINILKLTNTAIKALMNFLNIDTSSAGANGSQGLAGRYSEVSDAIQDVGDAAAKASKKVASFDDVITLDDGDTNTIADLLPSNDPDLNGLFNDDALDNEEITLDTIKNKLKEMLADLKEMMEGIDWQANIDKAGILGKALAELWNIVVDDKDLWSDFGVTVGGALNTILSFLNNFAYSFNFLGFGDSLALAWNNMLNTLDTELAGSAIYNWFMGAVDFFIGLLSNNVISNTVKKILDIITSSISNITEDDITAIGDLVTLILNEITNSIDYITEFLSNEENKQKLIAIITEIFTTIGQELPGLFQSLSGLIVSELNLLGDGISTSINELFNGLATDPDAVNKIVDSIINVIDGVFKNINKIGTAIKEHKTEIIELMKKFIQGILDNSSEWGKDLEPLVTTIADILRSLDWSAIRQAISNIITNSNIGELISAWITAQMQAWFTGILIKLQLGWEGIKEWFGDAFENLGLLIKAGIYELIYVGIPAINDFLNKIKEKIINWWNDLYNDHILVFVNNIKKIGSSIGEWLTGGTSSITSELNIGVHKLATGGIVDGSILANIGESGREAVLPLDKNTEWMDALADRMASRLNTTTNSNGTVEIKLSDKNFYTRAEMLDFAGMVVDALNVYGIDVAVS